MSNAEMEIVDNIARAIREDAIDKRLKFKSENVEYVIDDKTVPVGTEYFAHCHGWLKHWTKWVDKKVAGRLTYRAGLGESPVDRNDLDSLNEAETPNDPWQKSYELPLENTSTGEVVLFTTTTHYGKAAVRNVCDEWVKRTKSGQSGLPIIKLATRRMPSKHHVDGVWSPLFKIIDWDNGGATSATPENLTAATPTNGKVAVKDDMDGDKIPF
jgi:hypothetical protein